jgi:hypothetical protein
MSFDIEGLVHAGAKWTERPAADLSAVIRRARHLQRRRRVVLLISLAGVTIGTWLIAGMLNLGDQSADLQPLDPASRGTVFGDSCPDARDPGECEEEPPEGGGPLAPDHGIVEPALDARELTAMRAQAREFFDCLADAGYAFELTTINEKGLPIYEPVDSSQFVSLGPDAKGVPLYKPVRSIAKEFHDVEDACAGARRPSGFGLR